MASNPMGPGRMRGWIDFIAGIPVPTAFKAAVSFLAGITITGTTTTTTATVTGNETVGGTLGVTGATTTGQITATQPATGTTTAKVVGIAGSTVNLLEVDASAIANAMKWFVDKNGHLGKLQANPPTGVLGTGAGTGAGTAPVLTVTGDDHDGFIQIVTGTQVPVAGGAIVTVTFKTAMANAPRAIIVTNANGTTQALARTQDVVAPNSTFSATAWSLFAGAVALPASSTLVWWYSVR